MKALEILNKILKEINDDSLFLSEDFIPNIDIRLSIMELEVLENRSCDSCKHFKSEDKSLGKCENYCQQTPNYTTLDFCCNRYETNKKDK